MYPLVDIELSRKLERAEGRGNARFVEQRALIDPSRGATWIDVGGTYAMFDGPASPVTQTFGLGLFSTPSAEDFSALESFFHSRGAPADHEVSPLADPATLTLLNERGYRPIEFTSVLYQPIAGLKPCATSATEPLLVAQGFSPAIIATEPPSVAQGFSPAITVRIIDSMDVDLWARTASEGWGAAGGDFMRDVARINASAPDGHLFLAELDGRPVATAVLAIHGSVAHLAGASTIPAARGRGAQAALLDARLRYAAGRGCDLALMGALPGSGSQRNAERNGFRIAYTRIKWELKREESKP